MGGDGLLTGENNGDVPTLRTDASHRSITTPLRLYQPYDTTEDVFQAPSDGPAATSDPRLNPGADHSHSSPSLDTFTQSVGGMRSSSLSHTYPYNRVRSPHILGYNGIAQRDPTCQYNFNISSLTKAPSYPDPLQGSAPIPAKPAVPKHPSQDVTRSFTPTRSHRNPMAWSQRPLSPQLESSARSRLAPTLTTANIAGRSGHSYSASTQPFGTRDRQSGMVASRPSPYPIPNVSASGMLQSWDSDTMFHTILHPHPSLQRHIQRHRQYGSRKFTLNSGFPYDEPLFAPPKPTHPTSREPPPFLPAYDDGQNNGSSRPHATLGTNDRSSGVPTSIPHLEGTSGEQFQGSTLPLGAIHGHPSCAIDSPLSTYYGSATMANQTQRMQAGSSPQIQRHHQNGNQESASNSSSGYGESLCVPRPLYARGYGAPSSAHAFTDGRDVPSHATLKSSHPADAVPFPIPRNIGPTSRRDHVPVFQSFESPGDEGGAVASCPLPYPGRNILVDKMTHPQLTPPVYAPAYSGRGQPPPATTYNVGNASIPTSYLASSNGQQRYSLQNPVPWGSSVGPSTSRIPTRAHMYPSYGQSHNRELVPFTSPIYQSDLAISASSTRSFFESRLNDLWTPEFNPQGQSPDNPPPSHTPPVRHGNPHQHTPTFSSSYPEIGEVSSGLGCTAEEDRSAQSSLAVADQGYDSSAITPATYPPTTPNAQERLERVLEPSSPLKNKALIKLLLLIFSSPFFRMQEMEPTIDSDEGQTLLGQIQQVTGCPPDAFHVSNDSIFTLFVANHKFRCLICGRSKQSMVRGIGCIRSHLDHRPFPCLGEGGCITCPKDRIVKRFFTASLLHDHCNRQERETKCTSCGMILTSSMKRHWEARHPETPFPYKYYSNYHKE